MSTRYDLDDPEPFERDDSQGPLPNELLNKLRNRTWAQYKTRYKTIEDDPDELAAEPSPETSPYTSIFSGKATSGTQGTPSSGKLGSTFRQTSDTEKNPHAGQTLDGAQTLDTGQTRDAGQALDAGQIPDAGQVPNAGQILDTANVRTRVCQGLKLGRGALDWMSDVRHWVETWAETSKPIPMVNPVSNHRKWYRQNRPALPIRFRVGTLNSDTVFAYLHVETKGDQNPQVSLFIDDEKDPKKRVLKNIDWNDEDFQQVKWYFPFYAQNTWSKMMTLIHLYFLLAFESGQPDPGINTNQVTFSANLKTALNSIRLLGLWWPKWGML
ncbi:hypothetical protein BDV96DRAFT_653048 [Lophiotrema nucula]|uniref:Uncharacterized protein n=1 Tax=Lophiotrema nucula TaxID=690887 RepID=A0A6A5YN65_9PLEO|nr:hypothetical protein BDV96DRAFT_653048 [Lophiotrema nucula]